MLCSGSQFPQKLVAVVLSGGTIMYQYYIGCGRSICRRRPIKVGPEQGSDFSYSLRFVAWPIGSERDDSNSAQLCEEMPRYVFINSGLTGQFYLWTCLTVRTRNLGCFMLGRPLFRVGNRYIQSYSHLASPLVKAGKCSWLSHRQAGPNQPAYE